VTLSSSSSDNKDDDDDQLNIDSRKRNSKNIKLGAAGLSRPHVTLSDDDEDDEDEIRKQLETLSRLLDRHSDRTPNMGIPLPPLEPPDLQVKANYREQGITRK